LQHGAIAFQKTIEIRKFESDKFTENDDWKKSLLECDGVLIPGGFGERGWEGKILAAQFCREKKIPFFGICFGMQVMVVEYARNVLNLPKANSTEIDLQTPDPVISLLEEQRGVVNMGGTMRLGAYPCVLQEKSRAYAAYKKKVISERHRHRYEVNNKYKEALEKQGLTFSGTLESGSLCEIAEVENHPWMVGVQFHPEFQSKPLQPHPLFYQFVAAMIKYRS
jgi:CTP synthase